MDEITKEMTSLRNKANIEKIKAKQEKKYQVMEQERDWFRAEALQMSKLYKEQKDLAEKYKKKYEQLQLDKDYFQGKFYEEKLVSKEKEIEQKNLQKSVAKIEQSEESVKRMTQNMKELYELDAVKEYKFITEQIRSMETGEASEEKDPGKENLKKLMEENNMLKYKVERLKAANEMTQG